MAAATFTSVRRGFDQNEVRELLRMVAAELGRLQEREKFLERELRAAQHSQQPTAAMLDEDVVTKLLGEEAARILKTAREGAAQIRTRAEEGAARLLREATDEAQRLRQEAEVETARRRADAATDAESELSLAKQQGREMVNEARAYRERVLGELSRRRELARQQIDQLIVGRDRLLQAFERARLVAVDVMAEIQPLGEPSEYVNLAATTGPVPVMVPAASLAKSTATADEVAAATAPEATDVVDAVAGAQAAGPADDVDVDVADATVSESAAPPVVDLAEAEAEFDVPARPEHSETPDRTGMPEVADMPAEPDAADEPSSSEDEPSSSEEAAESAGDDGPTADVVVLFAGELDAQVADVVEHHPSGGGAESSVEGLFARLRAARLSDVAARAVEETQASTAAVAEVDEQLAAETTELDGTVALARVGDVFARSAEAPPEAAAVDESVFGRRDAELTPLIVACARKVKRVLADEQNELLHTLRRAKAVRQLSELLPDVETHTARYGTALAADLEQAAMAGAATVIVDPTPKLTKAAVQHGNAHHAAMEWFSTWLVVPLRERVERAIGEADGDNTELTAMVRSIYREWKAQRIDEHLDDVARMAYGRGQLGGLVPGTPICWAVDPNGPACPDAEDNSLAGIIPAGEAFPTGDRCAPAHEGCRCLVVVSE